MISRIKARIDEMQQARVWLAFPVAVGKKYGEDHGAHLAALVAYFAFFGIFPLLLVLVTVLGLVLKDNPQLQARFLDSALAQSPVVGDQLRDSVGSLGRPGLALAVGLVGAFIGARGMADAMQRAANDVWNVPITQRPGFPMAQLRNLALVLAVGVGLIASTVLTGWVTGAVGDGVVAVLTGLVVALTLNALVLLGSFRLATSPLVSTRSLIPGALIASVGWQVLQLLGSWLVASQISRASDVYGVFAVVIGLLSWLYLAAMMTVYALEVDVVRDQHLWPRSLFTSPLTAADEEAYDQHAQQQQRTDSETIDVSFDATELVDRPRRP